MTTLYQIQGLSPDHSYNLRNLGERVGWDGPRAFVLGKPRKDPGTRVTTIQDYDKEFLKRLIAITPSYEAEGFLEHHFTHTDYEPEKWLKHLEYEILPKEAFTSKNTNIKKLINEWLAKKKKEVITKLNKNIEGYYYNIPDVKTMEDADWGFISPLSNLWAGSEMSLPKVRPYLELHYNTYAGDNSEKKIEWLEYTRDLAKRHYNSKAFSDVVLNWIEKEIYKVESFTMNDSKPLSASSEATISKAKDQARSFRRFLGETQDLHKSLNYVEETLKFMPISEHSLFLNTLIQEINKFFPEETANRSTRNFELEQQWTNVILWAESKMEIASPDFKQAHVEINKYNIKWEDDKTNLLELIYALMESGTISYTKKEDVINAFAEFFNIEIKHPNQALTGMKRKRNRDNQAILLDKLKKSWLIYFNKKR